MKLEFLKCLSVMDRCLVLPHAVSRNKLYSALAAQRRENEEQMVGFTSLCSRKEHLRSAAAKCSIHSQFASFPKFLQSSVCEACFRFNGHHLD